ncbi:MAG: UrcA family protein [Steroidobacteraceae bacterium]
MSTFIPGRTTGSRAKIAMLLLGGLAGAMAAGAAGAATPDSVPTVVVKYSDLTLATDGGVNQLYRRIVSAAKQVCPDYPLRDLGAQRLVEVCRSQAVARAVQQIDNSRLAALYATHSKNG